MNSCIITSLFILFVYFPNVFCQSHNKDIASSQLRYLNDIEIYDELNKASQLSGLIPDGEFKFVFYFSEYNCPPCVNDYLRILNDLNSMIGNKFIIILAEFSNIRRMLVIKNTLNIKIPFYQVKSEVGIGNHNTQGHKKIWMGLLYDDLHIDKFKNGDVIDSLDSPYFDQVISIFYNIQNR